MSIVYSVSLAVLLVVLALAAYVDRVYSEMGKFLAREYQDNIDAWTRSVEPRFRLGRESIALSASVLRQLALAAIALIAGLRLYVHVKAQPLLARAPSFEEVAVPYRGSIPGVSSSDFLIKRFSDLRQGVQGWMRDQG